MLRSRRFFVPFLLTILFASVACGSTARRAGTLPSAHPDEVQISVGGLGPDEETVVTVQQPQTAQALYTAAAALPVMPKDQACTLQAGIQYQLTFREGGTTVATAVADKGGCGTVTFGTEDMRLANAAFWKLLDQTVVDNAPPVHPDRLDIASFVSPDQPPTLTSVLSAVTAQRLYDALRALPPLPQNQGCSLIAGPSYELAFYVGNKVMRATADRSGCGTAMLLGGNVIAILAAGGTRQADAAFWQLLEQALSSAPATKALPDQAGLKIMPALSDKTTSAQVVNITSPDLLRELYDTVYALPPRQANFSCTPTSGTVYGLTFLKGSITLLTAIIDEGACGTVTFYGSNGNNTNVVRLTTPAFEALLHQAEHS
ncbi:MAG: hypothetical protein OJF49_004028 [Ktedonobacterales bacterium]|jgi:hypothetical protein|nr:MAG: hypothetical protein OJF49_004028 [Ktedonobacterales bacterium]